MKVEEHRALQAAALDADAQAQRNLLAGDDAAAAPFLRESERYYRESWEASPPGGYGRLVGMLKAAILRDDASGAAAYAQAALAGESGSPTAAYALALAHLAAGDDAAAVGDAARMAEGGEAFARTSAALAALAHGDGVRYAAALGEVIADFEGRAVHLTGVAIADTALVLEHLARPRGLASCPASRLLPPC
jgi:hypothetical protein